MSRYTGAKFRIIRRLGSLSGFSTRNKVRKFTPGQHGNRRSRKRRRKKRT